MPLKRRDFLIIGSVLGLSSVLDAKALTDFEKEFKTLAPLFGAVQAHLFPKGSVLPSASSVYSVDFLLATMSHSSFDKDIRTFVLEGAKELDTREKGRFVFMNDKQKEKALREYEETGYGRSWLSRMMTLTMEGMFSDPIYGSNVQKIGWKSLSHKETFPRPKETYLGEK
jgi:hypothetical protein